jgi:hypothetical protein
MKSVITAILLTVSYVSYSQQLSYKVLKDEPDKIKNFTLHLDPFYADAWSTNTTLGFGVRADAMIMKRLSANVFFRKAYLDMNARSHADGSLPKPKNGFSKMTYFEPAVSFHIIDKLKKRSVKVVLSSSTSYSGNYKTTSTKYIMVPGTVRKIRGVRGGLFFVNTAIDMDQGEAIKTWTAKNGNETVTFGEFGTRVHGSAIYNGYSQMRQVALFGGLTFKSITNLQTEVEGYSKTRGNYNFYDFYVDVMYAPILSYQDVKFADGTNFSLSNSSNNRTGWRAGVLWKNASHTFLSYGFEFGQRPGYAGSDKGFLNSRSFLNMVMGISIPYNLKFIKS